MSQGSFGQNGQKLRNPDKIGVTLEPDQVRTCEGRQIELIIYNLLFSTAFIKSRFLTFFAVIFPWYLFLFGSAFFI